MPLILIDLSNNKGTKEKLLLRLSRRQEPNQHSLNECHICQRNSFVIFNYEREINAFPSRRLLFLGLAAPTVPPRDVVAAVFFIHLR